MPEPAVATVATMDNTVAEERPLMSADLQPQTGLTGTGNWSDALRPCALAAVVCSILVTVGLKPFVAMFGAGVLGAAFYRQRRPAMQINAWIGARLGVLAGLLWFGVSSVAAAIAIWGFGSGAELRSEMMKRMQEQASHINDPQALAMFDYLKTPAGFNYLIVFGIVFGLISAIVLSAAGGAASGAFLRRRRRS